MQKGLDPKRLVFIDETWASTNMARRYEPCERGIKVIRLRALRSLENDDVRGRPALRSHHGSLCL